MKNEAISISNISSLIYNLRNQKVILDYDLAKLYGYDVRSLNQQVKRNIERFPNDFMFQINDKELNLVKSQIVTSRNSTFFSGQRGGTRRKPYAFTEQGIYMLSTVLKSEIAIKQSIYIMRAFRDLKHFINNNSIMLEKIKNIELKQIKFEEDTNEQITNIYKLISKDNIPNQKIFYKDQIFDAHVLLTEIIKLANKKIVLIDNYVDIKTLNILSKRTDKVDISIYTTKNGNKILNDEFKDFKKQYKNINLYITNEFHDRFLILDNNCLYHIGASIKDAGNKCFAITKIGDKQILCSLIKYINAFNINNC